MDIQTLIGFSPEESVTIVITAFAISSFEAEQRDRIFVALTHFFSVSAGNHRNSFQYLFLRLLECLTRRRHEFRRRFPGIFYVLFLVLPTGTISVS